MTKNTPRIFISLLLMLLCIGILPVSAFASGGDYPDDALPTAESSAADTQETKQIGTVTTNGGNLNVRTGAGLDNTAFTQLPNGTVVDVIGRDGDWVKILLPARVGYVYGSYLTVTDAADSTVSIGGITLPFDEKELADLWQLLVGSMTGGSDALTPDGNLTLIDDIGSSTKAGKQFITLESKNGNVFYMIIDRDDEGEETVHFLNQVDEADLMALTGEEETPATCSCTTKCVAGTVNTSCPVCAVNMTECVGKEANGLRFLASRFHLLRRRFFVQPFGQSRNTARVQTDNMIFFFLKAADRIVAVYQHGKGGRLHSADIQRFVIEDREKAGRVNPDKPICLCSAKRGLIEVVIAAPVFEI